MIQARDIVAGCGCLLLLIVGIALLPLVCCAVKIGFLIALLLGAVALAAIGIAFMGKLAQWVCFHRKE